MADFDGVLSTGMTGHLKAWSLPTPTASLSKLLVRLFWDAWDVMEDEVHFTIDLSAFLLGEGEKARHARDLVFFGEPGHLSDSVIMVEDNLFYIDCKKIPDDIEKIRFAVTLNDEVGDGVVFGTLHNVRVKVYDISGVSSKILTDAENNPEKYRDLIKDSSAKVLANIDIADNLPDDISAEATELYKANGIWKIRTLNKAFDGDLAALCKKHGVDVQ
jgi:tellurium resistance protein TerD